VTTIVTYVVVLLRILWFCLLCVQYIQYHHTLLKYIYDLKKKKSTLSHVDIKSTSNFLPLQKQVVPATSSFFITKQDYLLFLSSYLFIYFCSIGAWTQGLHLEPFCVMSFFEMGVLQTICRDWLWMAILLIPASWVARITGLSHQHWTLFFVFF
jgi:hypothetical protein